jgi:plastocyanin domain-containing protein
MTRFFLLTLPFALLAAGCAGDNAGPAPAGEPAVEVAGAGPVEARLDAGVQVADIAVDGDTFRPAAIRLRPAVPARLVFTRSDAPTCADSIAAPDLGVETTALPVGVPVAVEFTPGDAGDYTLACAMDMVSARLVVQ